MSDINVIVQEQVKLVKITEPVSSEVRVVTVTNPAQVQIVTVGQQGPPGTSNVAFVEKVHVAGTAITVHHAVIVDSNNRVQYADSNTSSHAYRVAGISINSVVMSDAVTVRSEGTIEDATFNWVPGQPIYVGVNGTLTQSVPTSGFWQIIAMAITSKIIHVKLETPALL